MRWIFDFDIRSEGSHVVDHSGPARHWWHRKKAGKTKATQAVAFAPRLPPASADEGGRLGLAVARFGNGRPVLKTGRPAKATRKPLILVG
jgi:hypothetical protein